MNTHTPGPWNHIPMQDTIWDATQDVQICRISDLPSNARGQSNWLQEQANARLIAAAPDLIAALNEFQQLTNNLGAAITSEQVTVAIHQLTEHSIQCMFLKLRIAKATS